MAPFREQDWGRGAKGKERGLSSYLLGRCADDVCLRNSSRHVRSVGCTVPRALETPFTPDGCRPHNSLRSWAPPSCPPSRSGPGAEVGRLGSRSCRVDSLRDRLHPCGCLFMLSYRKPIINAVSSQIPGPALTLGLPALPAHGHREKGSPPPLGFCKGS